METFELEIKLAEGAGWDETGYATIGVRHKYGGETIVTPVATLLPWEVERWGERNHEGSPELAHHARNECVMTVTHRLKSVGFEAVYPGMLYNEVDYFFNGGPPREIVGYPCRVKGHLLEKALA